MGIRYHTYKDEIANVIFLVPYVHFSMELTICQMQPPDILFLLMFCISFYISVYHFPQILRTSFDIIWKENFVTDFCFLADSLNLPSYHHPHPLNDQNVPTWSKFLGAQLLYNITQYIWKSLQQILSFQQQKAQKN